MWWKIGSSFLIELVAAELLVLFSFNVCSPFLFVCLFVLLNMIIDGLYRRNTVLMNLQTTPTKPGMGLSIPKSVTVGTSVPSLIIWQLVTTLISPVLSFFRYGNTFSPFAL